MVTATCNMANEWLSSDLNERSEYVLYNNENSDLINNCCCILQGTCTDVVSFDLKYLFYI